MIAMVARGVRHVYAGGVTALDGLDLSIATGRRLAILGPNGAGKTTLLLHLNGTLKPAAGVIERAGAPARYDRASLTAWRSEVGLVLQEPDDQLFAATVAEDVSFGPVNLGLKEAEIRARVADALRALDIADLADRPTHQLSFGQKKRVAIAGALALRPRLLLLDEPTSGLDARGTAHLLSSLDALHRGGTTLVFTTHDVDLAWRFADDVALFAHGRVVAAGSVEDVLTDQTALSTAHLTAPFLATLGTALAARGLWTAPHLPRDETEVIEVLRRDGTSSQSR